jgi:hypothetical protein
VTSLTRAEYKARYLYEKVYCARGNTLCRSHLDRYHAGQSAASLVLFAYVLLCALRRLGLQKTNFAKATCGTMRLKLPKIGALVTISVRRIKVAMASGCPVTVTRGLVATRLAAAANARTSPA